MGRRSPDLTGKKFGELLVEKFVYRDKYHLKRKILKKEI